MTEGSFRFDAANWLAWPTSPDRLATITLNRTPLDKFALAVQNEILKNRLGAEHPLRVAFEDMRAAVVATMPS